MKRFSITYTVIIETDDETSMNAACDAVSLALWHLGDDHDGIETIFAELQRAHETHENNGRNLDGQPLDWNSEVTR